MEAISQHKGFFIFESLMFIFLGILAIALPGFFTLSVEFLIAFLFIIGAIVQLARIFQVEGAGSKTVTAISAIIYAVIGILLFAYPLIGILSITLLLAILFFAQGLIQLYIGFTSQFVKRWGWWIFSGIISIALALIIWAEWPTSAIWFIGILVGVNLLFYGFSLLFITLDAE